MRYLFLIALLACGVAHGGHRAEAQGRFIGEFELLPNPGGADGREKRLKYNFGFIDPNSLAWEARAGLRTDGASIPEWALPLIGARYDAEYIKAAVIHDHYCDRRVRTWEETHRMFYHALKAQGVSEAKASTMYYAVYNFGPRWQILRTGQRCALNRVCIRGAGQDVKEIAQKLRPARYGASAEIAARLAALEADIAAGRELPTPEAMEARARRENPDDPYYREPALLDQTVLVE